MSPSGAMTPMANNHKNVATQTWAQIMNNREPLEAAMVGTATFLSKTIMINLNVLGMLMLVMLGFIVSLIFGVMKRK